MKSAVYTLKFLYNYSSFIETNVSLVIINDLPIGFPINNIISLPQNFCDRTSLQIVGRFFFWGFCRYAGSAPVTSSEFFSWVCRHTVRAKRKEGKKTGGGAVPGKPGSARLEGISATDLGPEGIRM